MKAGTKLSVGRMLYFAGQPVGNLAYPVFPGGGTSNLTRFVKYNYSATANNGQINSVDDARLGYSVSYSYDSLKRLSQATASNASWSQTYGYDGFGNLTAKSVPSGSAEPAFPGVNSSKNWLNNATYDANGNAVTLDAFTLTYDMENRLSKLGSGTETYFYDESNHRIEKMRPRVGNASDNTADTVYFYGPDGRLLSTFFIQLDGFQNSFAVVDRHRVSFGGRLIGTTTGQAQIGDVVTDRLGTANAGYPYGTAISASPYYTWLSCPDFATYLKDTSTGLEYANARYYSGGYGRFLNADRAEASDALYDPGEWNKFSYVGNDPVNFIDPTGFDRQCSLFSDSEGNYSLHCTFSDLPDTSTGSLNTGRDEGTGTGRDDLGRLARIEEQRALAAIPPGFRQTVENAVGRAIRDLAKPKCAGLFGSSMNPADILETLFESGRIRAYAFDSSRPAGVGGFTNGAVPNPVVYLATNRFFFTGVLENGVSATMSPEFADLTQFQLQESVLIHELLHVTKIAGDDFNNQAIKLGNGQVVVGSSGISTAIRDHCFR